MKSKLGYRNHTEKKKRREGGGKEGLTERQIDREGGRERKDKEERKS